MTKLRIGDTVRVRRPQEFKPIRTEEDWQRSLMQTFGYLPLDEFDAVVVTTENIEELQRSIE